jgi:hypothetical protein
MVYITQHGTDGVGHQLHGLFSCMILHNIRDYKFDPNIFMNKPFNFEHLSITEREMCKAYMIEIAKLFNQYFKVECLDYRNHIHAHELINIPDDYDLDTIYTIDNAYYFDRLNMNEKEVALHNNNIDVVKKFFINDKLPPKNLEHDNIVIHFRLGDALTTNRCDPIRKYNETIKIKLPNIIQKYKNHTFYIHTDGDVSDIIEILEKNNSKYVLKPKNTNIMEVISDFIHAKILITGNSGLSKVCSFFGDKELIITHDDNTQSMPTEVKNINDM